MQYVREVVYKGRENRNVVLFKTYDPVTGQSTNFAWGSVTRIVTEFVPVLGGASVELDTNTQPAYVDKSVDGKLTFDIGDTTITAGDYWARITAYDAGANDTELANEHHPTHRLMFAFVATGPTT